MSCDYEKCCQEDDCYCLRKNGGHVLSVINKDGNKDYYCETSIEMNGWSICSCCCHYMVDEYIQIGNQKMCMKCFNGSDLQDFFDYKLQENQCVVKRIISFLINHLSEFIDSNDITYSETSCSKCDSKHITQEEFDEMDYFSDFITYPPIDKINELIQKYPINDFYQFMKEFIDHQKELYDNLKSSKSEVLKKQQNKAKEMIKTFCPRVSTDDIDFVVKKKSKHCFKEEEIMTIIEKEDFLKFVSWLSKD